MSDDEDAVRFAPLDWMAVGGEGGFGPLAYYGYRMIGVKFLSIR
jgi:hypothetical protein